MHTMILTVNLTLARTSGFAGTALITDDGLVSIVAAHMFGRITQICVRQSTDGHTRVPGTIDSTDGVVSRIVHSVCVCVCACLLGHWGSLVLFVGTNLADEEVEVEDF